MNVYNDFRDSTFIECSHLQKRVNNLILVYPFSHIKGNGLEKCLGFRN